MKCFFAVGGLLLLVTVGAVVETSGAQTENFSAGRGLGIGARFLPQALMPSAPSDTAPALGSALTLHYWVSDLLAIEVGGWLSGVSDSWNLRSFTSLSGGLLLKLSDNLQDDLYLAARAISVQSVYRNHCCIYREGEPPVAPQDEKIMPPYPWPSYESRTSTLAFAVTAGIERSRSSHVTTNLEFGFIYAQVMTTIIPPPVGSPPEEPIPTPQPETFAATSFGVALHISINFHLQRE